MSGSDDMVFPPEPFDGAVAPFDGAVSSDAHTLDAGVETVVDAGEPPMVESPPEPAPDTCPRVRITTVGLSLNVRSAPRTGATIVGTLEQGSLVSVVRAITGEVVDGVDVWYEIDAPGVRGFVSGRWAECTTAATRPTPPPSTTAPDGFYLPLACGMRARITQGNNSAFSHNGRSRYAFDFSIPRGTPLHAIERGTVIYVYDRTGPGDACYDGGGRECIAAANQVWVRHPDGTVTSYAHLNRALVARGDRVRRGDPVGRSGSSGYSTGPHAHVARQTDCGYGGCPSIRMHFEDVRGDGIPDTGDTVTSGNCP